MYTFAKKTFFLKEKFKREYFFLQKNFRTKHFVGFAVILLKESIMISKLIFF
jgi:hypothetical protein